MIDLSEHKIIIKKGRLIIRSRCLPYRYIDLQDLLKFNDIIYRSNPYSARKSQLNEVLEILGYRVKDKPKCQN